MTDYRLLFLCLILFTACQQQSFTDARDGQVYQLMQVGEQTWIEENIRYMPPAGGEGAMQTAETDYGTYYSWDEAQQACPDGFHLPSLSEWLLRMNSYEGSQNPRRGRFVHKDAKDSTLLYGGMYTQGRLVAVGRMGLYWTATDSTSTFGEEDGVLKPAYLGIHVYGDYSVKDSVNVEPTWSNTRDRLFNCKCIRD